MTERAYEVEDESSRKQKKTKVEKRISPKEVSFFVQSAGRVGMGVEIKYNITSAEDVEKVEREAFRIALESLARVATAADV